MIPSSVCNSLAIMTRAFSAVFLVCSIGLFQATSAHADEITVAVNGELEVPVRIYPASGDRLLLMLPSEYGFHSGHHELARSISGFGTEVWMADLFAAYFSPVSTTGMDSFSAADISALVDNAYQQTGKRDNQ